MAEESKPKWEGKAIVEVAGAGAEVVWQQVIADYCNLHKWLPLDTCYQVEGIQGQPGLIRYTAASSIKGGATTTSDNTTSTIEWAKEKLLKIDHIQRCLSYEILDNNMGFKSYVATWKVVDAELGCKIQWEFQCDPVEGWSFQGLYSVIESYLKFMANKIQSELARF